MDPMYCPMCGKELKEHGDFVRFWVRLFSCANRPSCDDYLHVADPRWIFAPLYRLSPGVRRRFLALSETAKEDAVAAIRQDGPTTVSIAGFERAVERGG